MVKMEKIFFEVIVFGSGLSAKTTIVSLFKKGIIPFWIENIQNYKINDDRTTMLSPKSFEMFKELGLKDFEKKSFPTKKINIKTQNQKNFTVFEDKKSLPICYLTENNVLHQELDTLISKIEKNKKLVKVKDEIRSIKSDSENNEIVLKSGDKIYSSLIIGVDGANSKIRKIQNIKTKDYGIKKFGLVAIMEHETSHPNVSWQVFSETGILALLAKDIKPNKRAVSSLIWSLDKKQIDAIRNLSSKDFEKKVKEEFGSFLGDLHLISKINEWPIFRIDVPNPTGTRTVLLGDAAHSIYPLAGQGFNLAIGDILQITDIMLWAKERGLDLGSSVVLNKYVNSRKFWVNSVTKMTDSIDWFFSNASNNSQNTFGSLLSVSNNFQPIKQQLVEIMKEN